MKSFYKVVSDSVCLFPRVSCVGLTLGSRARGPRRWFYVNTGNITNEFMWTFDVDITNS